MDITEALRRIRRIKSTSVDIQVAQIYAKTAMWQTGDELRAQILYILSNLRGWRGEEARATKKALKEY